MDWEPDSYGDEWAEVYDERFAYLTDTQLAVQALAQLARNGPVLELGVGTGRIAIPLAERGLPVTGVDASQAMLSQLAAKPGGSEITSVHADFSNFRLDKKFSLIYMSCNTLFDLPAQDRQIGCIKSAAAHLEDDGFFVAETSLPGALIDTPAVACVSFDSSEPVLECRYHDPITQQVLRLRITLSSHGPRCRNIRNRYIWPSELDLMAKLANLSLAFRWSGWEKNNFSASDPGYISGYRPAVT
jgi:SAM-dependent methyltransferase